MANEGRKPFRKPREPKEFDDVVVSINRVSKTVKGGRRMRFSALVVVGDHKGRIGFGMGKAAEVPDAIKKANEAAVKNVFRVQLVKNNKEAGANNLTVPSDAIGKHGATSVVLKPAAARFQSREPSFVRRKNKSIQKQLPHRIRCHTSQQALIHSESRSYMKPAASEAG